MKAPLPCCGFFKFTYRHTWLKGSEIARAVGLKKSAVSKIIHSKQADSMVVKETNSQLAAIAIQLGFSQ
jgi:hypothetical protein